MQEFVTLFTGSTSGKLPSLAWPGTLNNLNLGRLNPIPQKYRQAASASARRQRSKSNKELVRPQAVVDDLTALKRSFNPLHTIRAVRRHRWCLTDLQYVLVFGILVFSLALPGPPSWFKACFSMGLVAVLLMPITRQFFFPALPIITWLVYFFCSRFIPAEYRPHIWVRVLPALENVMYGANLSNLLSAHVHPVLDVLAWLPYGIVHFTAPFFCSLAIFIFAAPTTTQVFARSFGWMNIIGVSIQLVFPCTPPWYENLHGLQPAQYGMEGSPAGLARLDALFGVDMYTTSFTSAPLPFGAFPSLHAANATLEALFMSYCFPRFRTFFIIYVGWVWWATMYLSHHYAVDLVGGSLIAAVIYYTVRTRWLPRIQMDKRHRWEYDYIDIGEKVKALDEEYGYSSANDDLVGFGLGLLERRAAADSDEWTVGSRSSSSGSSYGGRSSTSSSSGANPAAGPSRSASATTSITSGTISPAATDDDGARRYGNSTFVVGVTPQGSVWDGEPLGRQSDLSEVVVVR